MGRPGMTGKHQNPATQGGLSAAFAGPIQARPAAAGREILLARLSRRDPPLWPERVQGWWPVTPPTAKTRLVYK